VNPIVDGALNWWSISSYASDSEEELENWQQRLCEVSTRRCAHIIYVLQWIRIEVCDPSRYDGLTDVFFFYKRI
jgi:hypothetical protein